MHLIARTIGVMTVALMCVDCEAEGITGKRPIVSGTRKPRCATHARALKTQRRINAHERHVQSTYGLSAGDYQRLYEAQGGLCAICGLTTGAKGASKRLTVDHDHKCCNGPISCGKCVRGLVCAKCNEVLGYYRDDRKCFVRGYNYLKNPPAKGVLGNGKA